MEGAEKPLNLVAESKMVDVIFGSRAIAAFL
jgi:hypothetical protein